MAPHAAIYRHKGALQLLGEGQALENRSDLSLDLKESSESASLMSHQSSYNVCIHV